MGGVSILLFGIIASAGLRMLVDDKMDFGDHRNLVIASVVLVIGVGGAALKFAGSHFEVEGMALATIVGILLNLFLPSPKGTGLRRLRRLAESDQTEYKHDASFKSGPVRPERANAFGGSGLARHRWIAHFLDCLPGRSFFLTKGGGVRMVSVQTGRSKAT